MKSCNYIYVSIYEGKPGSLGQNCPYPQFYERLRQSGRTDPWKDLADLPIDSSGLCIFHSRDVAWKRENDFSERFHWLLEALDAEKDLSFYDFAEFVFVGDDSRILRLDDRVFPKTVYFVGSRFIDPVEIVRAEFSSLVSLGQVELAGELRVQNTVFKGFELTRGEARQKVLFEEVEFGGFALFYESRFSAEGEGYAVRFDQVDFRGVTDFSEAVFSHGGLATVGFLDATFEDFSNFSDVEFECHTAFERVTFNDTTDFIDTRFGNVGSVARYRGTAVEFTELTLGANAIVTFKSNDPTLKMFSHDVRMRFKEDPEGLVRFENANFNKIDAISREGLLVLEKLGRVEIGPGCIKYRLQTEVRSIPVSQENSSLVIEICQTFSHYFSVSNGMNLGLEIIERDREKIRFFYFTDEDIPEAVFHERLQRSERDLWNLLSIRSPGQLVALEGGGASEPSAGTKRSLLNAVDGVSALIGTFFRVGARIALGDWRASDTRALLGAVSFDEAATQERATALHQVLMAQYTGSALLGLNAQQHSPMPLLPGPGPSLPISEKKKILFLGVNSSGRPLLLDNEVASIQSNLDLARERGRLELEQRWAVTPDSLMQVLIDESPMIVHFSGHGDRSGIYLRDQSGNPTLLTAQALASLFEHLGSSVECVVLNSCYSKEQAKEICRHVPYVVSMSSAIPDSSAVAFSTGFYKGIGAGEAIPRAFEFGKLAIQMMDRLSSHEIPVLLPESDVSRKTSE